MKSHIALYNELIRIKDIISVDIDDDAIHPFCKIYHQILKPKLHINFTSDEYNTYKDQYDEINHCSNNKYHRFSGIGSTCDYFDNDKNETYISSLLSHPEKFDRDFMDDTLIYDIPLYRIRFITHNCVINETNVEQFAYIIYYFDSNSSVVKTIIYDDNENYDEINKFIKCYQEPPVVYENVHNLPIYKNFMNLVQENNDHIESPQQFELIQSITQKFEDLVDKTENSQEYNILLNDITESYEQLQNMF